MLRITALCLLASSLTLASGCVSDKGPPSTPGVIRQSGTHRLRLFERSALSDENPTWPLVWISVSDTKFPAICARSFPIRLSDLGTFNEVLVSWNFDLPMTTGSGVSVECRVGKTEAGSDEITWAPFLELGTWGEGPKERPAKYEFDGGKIATDVFESKQLFDRIDVRLVVFAKEWNLKYPDVERLAICVSNTLENAGAKKPLEGDTASAMKLTPRLPVPFRSQRDVPEIGHRICSPTSTSMILAYRGVYVPTQRVASVAYDASHDIYGNWPRNVQAAYSLGVPGYLTRFGDWDAVERTLARGQPLVISVRVREGELRGAPYSATKGHLLAVCGFADNGDVEVNDPAASSHESGQVTYRREDLETVWFGRGGVAYVFLPTH